MGSGDADPILLCSSRMKGFQGSLYAEHPSHTLQLYNTEAK